MNDVFGGRKATVLSSAAAIISTLALYEGAGLSIAAAYLSMALDAACSEVGVDPDTLELADAPRPEF